MDNQPQALTPQDIKEIAAIEDIREMWGAENQEEMAERLALDICAVKFPHYMTDGPGYGGQLFLIMGGDLGAPLRLIRKEGRLKVVED